MLLQNYVRLDSSISVLNIGCGQGHESIALQKILNCNVIVIDKNKVVEKFSGIHEKIRLLKDDIYSINFNNKFNLIYCYHVLEHVNDPALLLKKTGNLLSQNGVAFFGFPNKNRIVGYLNPSPTQKVSLKTKILWNLNDYKHRLTGKFENKQGAHAGFTEKEFNDLAESYFKVINVTNLYYDKKYDRNKYYNILKFFGVFKFLKPSLYFILKKK